ncbi:MAG: hypothetical protein LUE26_06415 [Alistipes sp.]|nr:hypothetical protein [Alistipes sp.]
MTYEKILERLNKSITARYPQSFGFARRFAPLLNVSQSTVYNKLSGRTRFTVEELFFILHDLKIPVSELMEEYPNTESYPMELFVHRDSEPEKFAGMLDWYHGILSMAADSESSRLMVLSNTIPDFTFLDLDWLSAFSFQKWLFYNKGFESVIPLSRIHDDRTHKDKTMRCLEAIRNLKSTEYILSINIMRNYIQDLIMFYEYRIITKEEAHAVFLELNSLLEAFDKVCSFGKLPGTGKKMEIYYYTTHLFGNMHLVESDNIEIGFIFSHFLNPVVSKHRDTFVQIRSWYNTWKRSSVPISMAGIKNRMDFLNEQRKALDYLERFLGF